MAFDKGHALVIGIGTHQFAPRLNVPITVKDAEVVASTLQNADVCGYPSAQVRLLHDDSAKKQDILDALAGLARRVPADGTVLMFYCGHGALGTDGKYYLVSHDAKLADGRVVPGTGVGEDELLGHIRGIKAKRVLLIFNACHSGNISPDSLDTTPIDLDESSLSPDTAEALLGTGEGRVIITACREDQKSWIGKGSNTIFTTALVDGLRGRGVLSNGGYISVYGLYEHVYTRVSEQVQDERNTQQEPELTVIKGVGPFAVALFRGATQLGTFDEAEPVPQGPTVTTVKPERAQRVFSQRITQTGGVNFGQGNKIDIGGDVVGGDKITGDRIDARGSQGFINRPTGSVEQNYGMQVNTGGGAYVGGNVNTGSGNFVGRDQINATHNYYNTQESEADAVTKFSELGRRLYTLLGAQWFSEEDLEDLAFQLALDWDNLRGETKAAKARALVRQCEKHGLLENLRRLMRLARPNLKDQL